MHSIHEQADPLERELARRFRRLRAEESLAVPPWTEEPAAHRRAPLAPGGRGVALGLAASLVAVVVAALFAVLRPPSPDELYLDIMNANVLVTDELLEVSPLALPEQSPLPGLYEPLSADGTLAI